MTNLCVTMQTSHVCSFKDDKDLKLQKKCDFYEPGIVSCAHFQMGFMCQCMEAYSTARTIPANREDIGGDDDSNTIWGESPILKEFYNKKLNDYYEKKPGVLDKVTRDLATDGVAVNDFEKEYMWNRHGMVFDDDQEHNRAPSYHRFEDPVEDFRWACTAYTKGQISHGQLVKVEARMWEHQNGIDAGYIERNHSTELGCGATVQFRKARPLNMDWSNPDVTPSVEMEVLDYVPGMMIQSELEPVRRILNAVDEENERQRDMYFRMRNPVTRGRIQKDIEGEHKKTEEVKNAKNPEEAFKIFTPSLWGHAALDWLRLDASKLFRPDCS